MTRSVHFRYINMPFHIFAKLRPNLTTVMNLVFHKWALNSNISMWCPGPFWGLAFGCLSVKICTLNSPESLNSNLRFVTTRALSLLCTRAFVKAVHLPSASISSSTRLLYNNFLKTRTDVCNYWQHKAISSTFRFTMEAFARAFPVVIVHVAAFWSDATP